jgi:rsbT co-antagonist protein RsbR
MSSDRKTRILDILNKYERDILGDWLKEQLGADTLRPDLMSEAELRAQSTQFFQALREAAQDGNFGDIQRSSWEPVRELLSEISRSRALQGFSTSETATFVLSLKQPLFARLREAHKDADALADDFWRVTGLIDKLALHTSEMFQQSREDVIMRQQQEMFELSAPVVELWQGILALPVIGTLDSKRTQLMMEALLERIVTTQAEVAIIDITGVPTVDTLTAQHLFKTVSAARLMGADCLISGVRPQIAQTMVSLGVSFADIVTKSTMAGALAVALKQRGLGVKNLHPDSLNA